MFLASLTAPAQGALIGVSTSTSGGLIYEGLGDVGGGIGSGRLTIGACAFGGVNTVCTLTGNYVESPGSAFTPGATGAFSFSTTYAGSGPSPVIVQSTTPGGNNVVGVNFGGAQFALNILPAAGGAISTQFPALGFSVFFNAGATCSGTPAPACNIGQVGLTPGAIISGAAAGSSGFVFSIPDDVVNAQLAIPEPSTLSLLALGLIGAGFASRHRQRRA